MNANTLVFSKDFAFPAVSGREAELVKANLKYVKNYVFYSGRESIPVCFIFELYDARGRFLGNADPESYFLADD